MLEIEYMNVCMHVCARGSRAAGKEIYALFMHECMQTGAQIASIKMLLKAVKLQCEER